MQLKPMLFKGQLCVLHIQKNIENRSSQKEHLEKIHLFQMALRESFNGKRDAVDA